MLEEIAKTGLFFSKPYLYAIIILIGLFCNHKIFARVMFLLLFTMIYNLFLKSLWKIPLPLPLEGWAFPSGHMHSAFVFWVWLALEYRKFWFSACVFLILCASGYGLIYQGYHHPIDILGAAGFGTASIIIYSFLVKMRFFKNKPYCIGLLFSILGLGLILLIPSEGKKLFVWKVWGLLSLISLGWTVFSVFRVRPLSPTEDPNLLKQQP